MQHGLTCWGDRTLLLRIFDVTANIYPLESPAADKVPGGKEKNLFYFHFPLLSLPYLIRSSQSSTEIHKGKSGSRRPSRGAPEPGAELSMGASLGKKVSERVTQCGLFMELLTEEVSLLNLACMYEWHVNTEGDNVEIIKCIALMHIKYKHIIN